MPNNLRIKLWTALLAPALFVLALVGLNQLRDLNVPLTKLIAERGPPDILATRTFIKWDEIKILRLYISPTDPLTVTNWNSVTNIVAVWADGKDCRRNVRAFYDEMKDTNKFTGWDWYSSLPLFGEKLSLVKLDRDGLVERHDRVRVTALSMFIEGYKYPANPPGPHD